MSPDLKNELQQKMKSLAPDNKIVCAVALKLARDLKITPAEVGNAADELKIRIQNCQLGCFK